MSFLLRSSFQASQEQPAVDAKQEFRGGVTNLGLEQQIQAPGDLKEAMQARPRTRIPVQGHADVSSNEGSVLVPGKELPNEWSAAPDLTHLSHLDRGFVFPGEQIKVFVTVSSRDLTVPEIITPFKVAAVINKNALLKANPVAGEVLESNAGESLREEWHKKKSAQLLESFQRSHFYVSVINENKVDESDQHDEAESVVPVVVERDGFDPVAAGGIARRAITSCALANGDIVVMLEVTVVVPRSITHEAVLEVLQYEQHSSPMSASKTIPKDLDPAQDLLHWLLPLDRNAFTTQQSSAVPAANAATGTQRLSFGAANSTLFSFGHLRSSSAGSLPPVAPAAAPAAVPPYPPSALNTAPGEWNKLYPEKDLGSEEVGSEGLLSFRGVPLEPQRFSAHCGLEGLYVPGKRWCKKISVVQPLRINSYSADCNAEDLICVLIENVLPSDMSDVCIYIDSISIICQATSPGAVSQPIPVSCVETGEDDKLPNLCLRTGEQHSFILRPTSSLLKVESSGKQSYSTPRQAKEASDGGSYAVLVACHCSHTHSRFYLKHSLKWKPRPARDLLVSVSLESSTPTGVPSEALPQLKSQVVTVQATNLTSRELDLTLLAPSTLACAPVSVTPVTTNAAKKSPVGNSHSFREEQEKARKNFRSMSMPPGREKPKVKEAEQAKEAEESSKRTRERRVSAAEIVAENSPARTHLWLQSTVPLGRLPAHSTTVVKCDLLPLADGIITLDTLHLASKDRETLFVPINPLQIHSSSGISK
ncbi:uncharacterized protein LOC9650308 [Selaginella moellendorffii]|uniref:uncharacterized protein LOC9650308 n=1 Tax=Selaginella moellendorffii TaxID=88036 RepID=UPI000D1C44FA|nr:uncharacterized protein LOC9650308 [Selaginella moellendorffii]|eukprot:XP_024528913.1 uncharacterized protein LOC9650308 [Selaginella moellendorffii]